MTYTTSGGTKAAEKWQKEGERQMEVQIGACDLPLYFITFFCNISSLINESSNVIVFNYP